jgi:predicted transcriptional regulator
MPSRFEEGLSPFLRLRKRSDIDIMANILSEARKGARKTRLMYRGNLSHRRLQVYLKLLLGLELLALHSNIYKTTVKGLKFLDAYRTVKALMT